MASRGRHLIQWRCLLSNGEIKLFRVSNRLDTVIWTAGSESGGWAVPHGLKAVVALRGRFVAASRSTARQAEKIETDAVCNVSADAVENAWSNETVVGLREHLPKSP